MKLFKGFDRKLRCRGFQYEIGEEYEEDRAELCEAGFHACENPIDVFSYYPPSDSRYCEVELDGLNSKTSEDSKRVGRRIKIGAEIGIKGIVDAFIKFTMERIDFAAGQVNTGDYSAATNTGYQSAATNTGNCSAATNTGYQSAAEVKGAESIAIATGIESKAAGAIGCYIVFAEWEIAEDSTWHIKAVRSHKVDGKVIKPGVFYKLENGKFVKAEE